MTRTRTSVLGATFILLAGALALTLVLLAGRSSGGNQLNVKVGASLSGPNSKEATAGEGPVGGYEAYLSASRTYPAAAIPPAVVARAKATFNRIAKRDARLAKSHGRRFLDSGGNWKQYGPRKYALQPGVTSFSGATNDTASRITALVADPDCSATELPRLGRSLRRRRLADRQRRWLADPAVDSSSSPDDLDQNSVGTLILDPSDTRSRHALPRHRRGQPLLVRLRGRRRHLQVDRRRQPLDEAQRHVRQQRDLPVRDSRARTRSSGRGINSIVIDPTEHEPHLRRLGARGPRPLARDRQRRRRRAARARRERARRLRVDRRRQRRSPRSGTATVPHRSAITDVALDPLNPRPSTRRRSTRARGAGRRSTARRRRTTSARSSPRSSRAAGPTGRCSR